MLLVRFIGVCFRSTGAIIFGIGIIYAIVSLYFFIVDGYFLNWTWGAFFSTQTNISCDSPLLESVYSNLWGQCYITGLVGLDMILNKIFISQSIGIAIVYGALLYSIGLFFFD